MSLLNTQLEQLIENARLIKAPEFVTTIEEYRDLFKRYSFRLRPSVNSISLVSCSSSTPQLGFSDITNATGLKKKLEALKQEKISLEPPRRKTPEKALQSWLISQAITNGQQLKSLDAVLKDGHSYRFVSDEISLKVSDDPHPPGSRYRAVADLLLIRTNDQGESEIVNVELKSQRSTETFKQIDNFWEFMGEGQRKRWREFIGIMLGGSELRWKEVDARRGIVVWPAPVSSSSKRTKELLSKRKANGIDTICYTDPLYEFESE